MTCGFLIQLVFCKKKLCGLLEETSAPPPKKNPGSAPTGMRYMGYIQVRVTEKSMVFNQFSLR